MIVICDTFILLGGLLESAPLFSSAMPSSNANQIVTSSQPTTASVTFGVPTIASMTQKQYNAPKPSHAAATTSKPAEFTAAYVKSTQTKLEEADSESSMPCSLPDDIANRYARYIYKLYLSSLYDFLLYSVDAMRTVSDPTTTAAAAANM